MHTNEKNFELRHTHTKNIFRARKTTGRNLKTQAGPALQNRYEFSRKHHEKHTVQFGIFAADIRRRP